VSIQFPGIDAAQSELQRILNKQVKSSRDVARGITIIESEISSTLEIDRLFLTHTVPIFCKIGITGAPGVGKSSFTNSLINLIDLRRVKVAILAVDPSSRKTKGALLADRIRIDDSSIFEDLYFRSLASRGTYGGLVQNIDLIIKFLGHCGFQVVLVESVGVGQNEIEIENFVDVLIQVVDSKVGDSIQIGKAGVMEVGDIFFVNKADLEVNMSYVEELATLPHLNLKHSNPSDAIVVGSALNGDGITKVFDLISQLTESDAFLKGNLRNG
jgi:LAO/AO transport system kinase